MPQLRRFLHIIKVLMVICSISVSFTLTWDTIHAADEIPPLTEDVVLPEDSNTAGGGDATDPSINDTGDIRCPKADPATGIAYVCGYIKSNFIENMIPGDPSSPVITGKPVVNATIAMYEALPTSSGKNPDVANWGLGGLHFSTNTDENGYFKIKMRMQGPDGNLAYPVVLCDGVIGGIGRVNSMFSISDVFYVNCSSRLSYATPPDILKYVTDADRNTVLQCDTSENLNDPNSSVVDRSIGYTNKTEEQDVDAAIWEREFDIRFATKHSLNGLIPPHEGSWWSWDCVLRSGSAIEGGIKKCFTTYDIPGGDFIKSPPLKISSSSDDPNFGEDYSGDLNMRNYLTANILDTLPQRPVMSLYRRFELRENPTTLLQFEKAPASYLQTIFGGVAGSVNIPVRGTVEPGKLVPCENFKNAGKFVDVPGIINSQTAGGPSIGLSSPYQWEEMYNDLVDNNSDLLNLPVCSYNGVDITLRQIEPYKGADDGSDESPYVLSYEYFNPIFLLDKGSGALGRTADSKYDSITSGGSRPDLFRLPADTEAEDPDKTASNIVLPQDASHLSSVVAASKASQKGAYLPYGSALTDVIAQPFKTDYIYNKGKVIWDWGAAAKALCSKPAYGGAVIDNDFKAIQGDQAKTNTTPTTQIYYTPISFLRDSILQGSGKDISIWWANKDVVDSYLSSFEAADYKLAIDSADPFAFWNWNLLQPIKGTDPSKSFYQRKNLGDARVYNITLDYPLNEADFPSIFTSGNLEPTNPVVPGDGNPTGTGSLGGSDLYPWVSTDCNVWGNQYKDNPNKIALCNDDPQCLRTCRIDPDSPCANLYYNISCRFFPVDGMCACTNSSLQRGSCSPEQNFECVIQGEDGWVGTSPSRPSVPGDPSDPYDFTNCLKEDGTYGDIDYGGENHDTNRNHLTCDVQQAGPYNGIFDLGEEGSGRLTSFHSMQEPVNINPATGDLMKQGEQTPIDPILSSANLMVQSFAPPFAGTKSYEGLGCIDYENTKNAEPGTKRMWCKDTPRVGDAGTSSAMLSIAAGPVFSDSGSIGYDPTIPPRKLFAGPVFAAFPTGECNPEEQPDGVCDLAPFDPAQPLPTPVTMDLIQNRANANSTCKLTSCNLNVGIGFEDPIPQALKDILSAAGADWNVPAKVVLAFMYAEGYFAKAGSGATAGEWLKYNWTEQNILAWSLPVEGTIVKKGFMTPCDDLNWGEQGAPSMFISDWDDANRSACSGPFDNSLKCGIEKLVTGRGQYARRCNLLDSAYGLAKSASEAANSTSCNWTGAQYAAALGAFTGSDPMAKPGSPYYSLMESVITNCRNP